MERQENIIGIQVLRPPLRDPQGIERLGPPPDNTWILIQGGAGWVFGITESEETQDPRIVPERRPTPEEVALAFAREMAWRWFRGRDMLTGKELDALKKRGPRRSRVPYADIERSFVEQAFNLPHRMPTAERRSPEPKRERKASEPRKTPCDCMKNGFCCDDDHLNDQKG